MPSRLSILAAFSLLLSASTGFAQQTNVAPQPGTPAKTVSAPADPSIFANARQGETDWLATNFINHTIYGPNEEKLGKIIDMMFDDQGRPTAAIMGVGGFWGSARRMLPSPSPRSN